MADAAVAAALRTSATAEPLAFRVSQIGRSDDRSNNVGSPADLQVAFRKGELRISSPKTRRKSARAIHCSLDLPAKFRSKDYHGSGKTISTNAVSKNVVALGLSCKCAWSAVKLLCRREGRRESLASAAVAAAAAISVGFSLSLSPPAVADSVGVVGSGASFTDSGYVVDDIDVHLNRKQTLALTAELRKLSASQKDRTSEQAARPNTEQQDGSLGGALPTSGGLIARKDTSESSTSISSTPKSAVKLPDASTAETTGALVPVSCPASSLVAVATVGSMASAGSVAGNALTQSSALVNPSTTFPGAQLLAKVLQHLGGGGVAGAVGASVVYPLDTIKTRMQAQRTKSGEEPHYKDEFDCFRRVLLDEGPGSLYNGLLPQLLGIAPEKALKLAVNDVLLEMLEQLLPGARVWLLEFVAGGGGGFSQVLVTNPMEIVKLRMQMQSSVTSSKVRLGEVVKGLGLQGLYWGSGLTLARDVPGTGLFFACYALFNQLYPDQSFWAGFLAAIPATVLVTPFDVVKTRLQMETPPGEQPYRDAWHCFTVLWEQEGLRGLFKGGLMRVLRTSPQFGITLMIYSFFCSIS